MINSAFCSQGRGENPASPPAAFGPVQQRFEVGRKAVIFPLQHGGITGDFVLIHRQVGGQPMHLIGKRRQHQRDARKNKIAEGQKDNQCRSQALRLWAHFGNAIPAQSVDRANQRKRQDRRHNDVNQDGVDAPDKVDCEVQSRPAAPAASKIA